MGSASRRGVHPGPEQAGATLAMVMIVLLVLSVMAVATLGTSHMQTLQAKNVQLGLLSLHNAENAVAFGERAWTAELSACLEDRAACVLDPAPPLMADVESIAWESRASAAGKHGHYIVEYLGARPLAGSADRQWRLYRITGRGRDPSASAATLVQTVVRFCVKKDGLPCPQPPSGVGEP